MIRRMAVAVFFSLLVSAWPARAQSEGHLREYFEGTQVVPKLDMPATKEGVNLRADRLPRIDRKKYEKKLNRYGTSIHQGWPIRITLIKVKKKHIEFQLGGGGYGSQSVRRVTYPLTPKSEQELHLEEELAVLPEDVPETQHLVVETLEHLHYEREQEDAHLRAQAAEEYAAEKRRVREIALAAGSRFNLRFNKRVPRDALTPEGFMAVLAEYVDFSPEAVEEALQRQAAEEAEQPEIDIAEAFEPSRDGEPPAALRKGLLWEDVVELLGRPSKLEERREGSLQVLVCTFENDSYGRVETKFVEDVLVRFTPPLR